VKTDVVFQSMAIESNGLTFFFDASSVEYKKNNERRNVAYELKDVKDNMVVFSVKYEEGSVDINIYDIVKALGNKITETELKKVFRKYERKIKQTERDFFVHKNIRSFLQEQLKLRLGEYVYNKELKQEDVKKLQITKEIAHKIIDKIGVFEDEMLKLWEMPKTVINANYMITLDRIAMHGDDGLQALDKILNHEGIKEQVMEWKTLGIVGDGFSAQDIKTYFDKYKLLPIDTKYFKDIEADILGLFGNIEETLDGWLIKSENWQALNTILNRFVGKVQTIYIDPPFNKNQNADYLYNVKYKDSTWITMLENRLRLAKEILSDSGSIFVRCDYNGNMYVRLLMNEIFGEDNFRNEITIAKSKEFFKTMTHISKFAEESESLFFFSKSEKSIFNPIYIEKDKPSKYEPFLPTDDKSYRDFRIINGKKYYSPFSRKWGIKQEDIDKFLSEGRLKFEKGKWYLYTFEGPLKDVWMDYQGYSRTWGFKTENSEIFIKRAIESTSNEGDLIMDFFLGSGTTIAVAHKLKRKWIGVEMGEHFWTVILPRMKKVLAYDKSGISKLVPDYKGGGFFVYFELEQFDDVLDKLDITSL